MATTKLKATQYADIARAFSERDLPDPLPQLHSFRAGVVDVTSQARSILGRFLKDAVVGLVDKAADSIPFGSVAMAFMKDVARRAQVVKKNKEAARKLASVANSALEVGDDLVRNFHQAGVQRGEEKAQLMMLLAFLAMRLVGELEERKGVMKTILLYVGCDKVDKALERLTLELKDAKLDVALWAGALALNQNAAAGIGTPTDADWGVLRTHAGEDAVIFWRDSGLPKEAPIGKLLEALTLTAQSGNLLPANVVTLKKVDRVHSYFSDLGNGSTVSITCFAIFLGKYQSRTVADALRQLLIECGAAQEADAARPEVAAAAVPTGPHGRPQGISLLDFLRPVDAGEDFARHLAVYQPGTREWVFRAVQVWARLPASHKQSRVFWLKGDGGLGKSVVAAQLVDRFGNKQRGAQVGAAASGQGSGLNIAAYFFCKQDDMTRNNPRRVVATLAFRLASVIPEMKRCLKEVLADESRRSKVLSLLSGASGTLVDLYNRILVKPLTNALKTTARGDIFIVVDALDELRQGSNRTQLLQLIGQEMPRLHERVRFIFTSRPEPEDIVAHFAKLNPYTISRQDERQQEDLRLYAREHLVAQTSLRNLSQGEKDRVVTEALDRSNGMFLALHLLTVVVKAKDAELQASAVEPRRSLGVQDVFEFLRNPADLVDRSGDLVDRSYLEIFRHVCAQIHRVAGDNDNVRQHLSESMTRIIAVLLASRQPLSTRDVLLLFSGQVRYGDTTRSHFILSALSTLFTAIGATSPIEPLHKSLVDFLRDESKSNDFFVDERMGHAVLASATFRVLRDHGLLPTDEDDDDADDDNGRERDSSFSRPRLVQPADVASQSAVKYVLRHGHMHLAKCAKESARADSPPCCLEAVMLWQDELLCSRLCLSEESIPREYILSSEMATAVCGAWMLLSAHTSDRKRQMVKDFLQLDDAISRNQRTSTAPLRKLVREMMQGFVSRWTLGTAIDDAISKFIWDLPLAGFLHQSPGTRYLAMAVGQFQPLLKVPGTVTEGSSLRVLRGHTNEVTSLVYSQDGRRIISGSVDGSVRVWDAQSGEALFSIVGHHGDVPPVLSVASCREKQWIVSGSDDRAVRVWDARTGELLKTLIGHEDAVCSVACSPDGSHVISGSWDKTVRVWNGQTGATLFILSGHSQSVISVAYCPRRKWIASGSSDGTVRVWNAETGAAINTLTGHTSFVDCVAFSPAGDVRIASASGDHTVRVWDHVDTSSPSVLQLQGHLKVVTSVAFSPDGSRIVSGSKDNTLRVWDARGGEAIRTLHGHDDKFTCVAYSPDGRRLITGGECNLLRLWDAQCGDVLHTLPGHADGIDSLAFNADGKKIVSLSHKGAGIVFDSITGELMHGFHECKKVASSGVAYSQDDPDSASASATARNSVLRIWNVELQWKKEHLTLRGHVRGVLSMAFSTDGKWIVTGSADGVVSLWSGQTGRLRFTCTEHNGVVNSVTSVAISSDGRRIVSGSRDRTVRVWQATREAQETFEARTLEHGDSDITVVALSPDADRIASGSEDCTVRVWNVELRTELRALRGHTKTVTTVLFSPDGRWILSGSGDRSVRVWNARSWEAIHTLLVHTDRVTSLAISTDGLRLLSGSEDKTLRVWNLNTGSGLPTSTPKRPLLSYALFRNLAIVLCLVCCLWLHSDSLNMVSDIVYSRTG